MAKDRLSGKLAVILHADIAGSTALVQQDELLAHERIQDTFRRFSGTIERYQGRVRELRGDALLAEFDRASDAVTAVLAFQAEQAEYIAQLNDNIQPVVRVGIALGEVIIADNTMTGAGVEVWYWHSASSNWQSPEAYVLRQRFMRRFHSECPLISRISVNSRLRDSMSRSESMQ